MKPLFVAPFRVERKMSSGSVVDSNGRRVCYIDCGTARFYDILEFISTELNRASRGEMLASLHCWIAYCTWQEEMLKRAKIMIESDHGLNREEWLEDLEKGPINVQSLNE